MSRRACLMMFPLVALSMVEAWSHHVQYDYDAWAREAREYGYKAREALDKGESTPDEVAQAAMERYEEIWDECDTTPHHSRFFAEMRGANYVAGIIAAEMEKGFLYTAMAARFGTEKYAGKSEAAFQRAHELGVEWTNRYAAEPPGDSPWYAKRKYTETNAIRRSAWLTLQLVRGALAETEVLRANDEIPIQEAYGRILSLAELDNLAPHGPRKDVKTSQEEHVFIVALASLDMAQAVLGELYRLYLGKEFEADFVARCLDAAEAKLKPLFEPDAQPEAEQP